MAWRIERLSQLVGEALESADYRGQSSGRVREVPDVRTIRYYTSVGLVDRPLEMRGRTAYYGPRHLLQLVSIKKLQAQGMPLVEVQQRLAAADDRQLAGWAELPPGFLQRGGTADRGEGGTKSETTVIDRQRFWAARPGLAREPVSAPPDPRQAGDTAADGERVGQVATVVPTEVGLTLILEGVLPEHLDREFWEILRSAMAALHKPLSAARRDSGQRLVGAGPTEKRRSETEENKE